MNALVTSYTDPSSVASPFQKYARRVIGNRNDLTKCLSSQRVPRRVIKRGRAEPNVGFMQSDSPRAKPDPTLRHCGCTSGQ